MKNNPYPYGPILFPLYVIRLFELMAMIHILFHTLLQKTPGSQMGLSCPYYVQRCWE